MSLFTPLLAHADASAGTSDMVEVVSELSASALGGPLSKPLLLAGFLGDRTQKYLKGKNGYACRGVRDWFPT